MGVILLKRAAVHAILVVILMVSILPSLMIGRSDSLQESPVNFNETENKATVGSGGYIFSFIGQGGTPFYRFSDPDNRTYKVKFMKLIEFTDENENGVFDSKEEIPGGKYALPSAKWSFNVNEDEQTFTFTTADSSDDPIISFVNHYDAEQPEILKFDIHIANWEWLDDSNMLALQFTFLSEDNPDAVSQELENGIKLDETAYFESIPTAKIDGSDTPVGISNKVNSIYLAYTHFDLLEHDPILGFYKVPPETPTSVPEVTPDDIPVIVPLETSWIGPGIIGNLTTTDYIYGLLVATALLITVVYSKRR